MRRGRDRWGRERPGGREGWRRERNSSMEREREREIL
jgi:hypothetical protein